MKNFINLRHQNSITGIIKHLPSSKSISNRVLILDALSGGRSALQNLSEANDTQLMKRLITSNDLTLDVEDAGTTMRFLTAFLAVSGKRKILTGSDRMKQRPLGILINALHQLGADIQYLEKEGFPPIEIRGFAGQQKARLSIRGDVSSQYISALMMIAPTLPQGLTLVLEGKVGSKPYIEMTASLMRKFGAEVRTGDNIIEIPYGSYQPTQFTVEADWSASSYWYSFAMLAQVSEVWLPQVTLRSLQGDRVIVDMMERLGVKSEPRGDNLLLVKKDHVSTFEWDFTHCPDLAQTIAVICAVKEVKAVFTGLESLRIKETDRIQALQTELLKLGATLREESGSWVLTPSSRLAETFPVIRTYLDHRMAMAFAPLATLRDVTIENPGVVEKSYPRFWDDVRSVGINASES